MVHCEAISYYCQPLLLLLPKHRPERIPLAGGYIKYVGGESASSDPRRAGVTVKPGLWTLDWTGLDWTEHAHYERRQTK